MTNRPIDLGFSFPRRLDITNIKIDFNQGQNGTCQTLTVFLSINRHRDAQGREVGEERLARMVTGPDRNGNYTVNFPGRPNSPIRVTAEDLRNFNLPTVTASTNPSLYRLLPVLEAAYVKIHRDEDSVVNPFELMLGQNTPVRSIPASLITSEYTTTLLQQGREGRDLIINGYVFGSADRTIQSVDGRTINMPTNHAYSIQVEGSRFFIMNPHNTRDRFEVTREQIGQVFTDIVVAPAPGTYIQLPPRLADLDLGALTFGRDQMRWIGAGGAYSVEGNRPPTLAFSEAWEQRWRSREQLIGAITGDMPFDAASYPAQRDLVPRLNGAAAAGESRGPEFRVNGHGEVVTQLTPEQVAHIHRIIRDHPDITEHMFGRGVAASFGPNNTIIVNPGNSRPETIASAYRDSLAITNAVLAGDAARARELIAAGEWFEGSPEVAAVVAQIRGAGATGTGDGLRDGTTNVPRRVAQQDTSQPLGRG